MARARLRAAVVGRLAQTMATAETVETGQDQAEPAELHPPTVEEGGPVVEPGCRPPTDRFPVAAVVERLRRSAAAAMVRMAGSW